jgi:hypothetical protein
MVENLIHFTQFFRFHRNISKIKALIKILHSLEKFVLFFVIILVSDL